MTNSLETIISNIEEERDRLDRALSILRQEKTVKPSVNGHSGKAGGKRRLSAAARNKIAVAAKKRWAKRKKAGFNRL
jgi:hypothetical protein